MNNPMGWLRRGRMALGAAVTSGAALALPLLAAVIATPTSAVAQISVDRVIFTFNPKERPVRNVAVMNSGDEPLFVSVVADVMVNPGAPDEKRQETEDIIVSPKRFSVDAKGQRTVRLLMRKPLTNQEGVYRIKFVPQLNEFAAAEKAEKGKQAMVKVLTGVGILIFAGPLTPEPKLTWKRDASKIVFSNEGNVNVFLDEGKTCSNGQENCTSLTAASRVYPGTTWEVPVSGATTVVFRKQVRDAFENIVVGPAT